jgi:hypothetical protein
MRAIGVSPGPGASDELIIAEPIARFNRAEFLFHLMRLVTKVVLLQCLKPKKK